MDIFISGLVYDNGKSGISEYINSLVLSLLKHDTVTITLLKNDAQRFPVKHENLRIQTISDCFSNPLLNILWHIFLLPILVFKSTCDFLILPAVNRRMLLWSPKPVLGIAHDLSQYAVSEKYDIFRIFYVKTILPMLLHSLTWVVAISQNTKKDLVKYWGLNAHEISVSYNGYDRSLYQSNAPDNLDDILDLYSLNKGYLFYVSRIEHPGKNHIKLIEAFEALPNTLTANSQLVFAGGDWNRADEVKKYIQSSPKSDKIKLLGYVPIDHLPALYHGAKASVFPSLYEGFGIPLIEAMACGTPTICSNNSALGEVAASAALTFNPESAQDIRRQLEQILSNKQIRTELSKKGLARCLSFDWNKLVAHIRKQLEPSIN